MEKISHLVMLEATAAEGQAANPMGDINGFMSIMMILIGVFALYSAFTGKGPAFKNDYPKAMKEDANEMLRKFCWLVGPVALVSGIFEYMYPDLQWINLVSMGIILPAIVVYVIMFRKRFKKYL